eukprot:8868073-Karenia_brevis.AAC.1
MASEGANIITEVIWWSSLYNRPVSGFDRATCQGNTEDQIFTCPPSAPIYCVAGLSQFVRLNQLVPNFFIVAQVPTTVYR